MKNSGLKNTAGIGGKREDIPCMGGFVSMTGGGRMQRLHDRDYSKVAHKDHDTAASEAMDSLPLLNISEVKVVR